MYQMMIFQNQSIQVKQLHIGVKPKNKASALNRILGMTSGFNKGMFNTKVDEYMQKFNITDKDITKWHAREKSSHDNEPGLDPNLVYGGKRKTKKTQK